MMTRRESLRIVLAAAPFAVAVRPTIAQTMHWEWDALGRGELPFRLPALPYETSALAPHLKASTLAVHHNEVHAAIVTTLNKAIGEVGQFYIHCKYKGFLADNTGELLLQNLDSVPEKLDSATGQQIVPKDLRERIRKALSAHYNHSLCWQGLKPNGGGEPSGELAAAIKNSFGSFATFKQQFAKTANRHRGDGWAWLTLDRGTLKLETSPNEETPLSAGRPVLLGIDLCAHAYERQYANRRADYVTAWFNVVDWNFVAERFSRFKEPRRY
jgi:Fe-Mn family superoxide dismutase